MIPGAFDSVDLHVVRLRKQLGETRGWECRHDLGKSLITKDAFDASSSRRWFQAATEIGVYVSSFIGRDGSGLSSA